MSRGCGGKDSQVLVTCQFISRHKNNLWDLHTCAWTAIKHPSLRARPIDLGTRLVAKRPTRRECAASIRELVFSVEVPGSSPGGLYQTGLRGPHPFPNGPTVKRGYIQLPGCRFRNQFLMDCQPKRLWRQIVMAGGSVVIIDSGGAGGFLVIEFENARIL